MNVGRGFMTMQNKPGILEYRGKRHSFSRAIVDSDGRVMMHLGDDGQWYMLGEAIEVVADLIEREHERLINSQP